MSGKGCSVLPRHRDGLGAGQRGPQEQVNHGRVRRHGREEYAVCRESTQLQSRVSRRRLCLTITSQADVGVLSQHREYTPQHKKNRARALIGGTLNFWGNFNWAPPRSQRSKYAASAKLRRDLSSWLHDLFVCFTWGFPKLGPYS